MRGIAPCEACHGEVGNKASAAWLEGQPAIYLRTQLEAFATGARHNDIGEQMRRHRQLVKPGQTNAGDPAVSIGDLLPTDAPDFRPDLECLGPKSSMLRSSNVIAAEVEEVIDLIVG